MDDSLFRNSKNAINYSRSNDSKDDKLIPLMSENKSYVLQTVEKNFMQNF